MAGEDVQAYIPSRDKTLPDLPTKILKVIYASDESSNLVRRAWEQYCRKYGFSQADAQHETDKVKANSSKPDQKKAPQAPKKSGFSM